MTKNKTKSPTEYKRVPTGEFRDCTGDAHSNPYIDHCMVCLNHTWGKLPVYETVDLEKALADGFDVRVSHLDSEQFLAVLDDERAGKALIVGVTRKTSGGGSASYNVVRRAGQ